MLDNLLPQATRLITSVIAPAEMQKFGPEPGRKDATLICSGFQDLNENKQINKELRKVQLALTYSGGLRPDLKYSGVITAS